MTIPADVIEKAVVRYGRERDRYLKLAARVADLVSVDIVEKNALRAQVTSRTKTVRSFEGKLGRFARFGKKTFKSADEVFEGIGDFSGVRVATYRPEDQELVSREISRVFRGPDGGEVVVDHKDNIDFKLARFYRAIHFQVCLPEEELVGDWENLRGTSCEIQVCSMMAHVWNEIEHDIAYKPAGTGPEAVERGLLTSLGHLTCSGDALITRLLEATERRLEQQTGDFADVHDFVARLRVGFPELEFAVNAGVAFEIAQLLRLTNPGLVLAAAGDAKNNASAAQKRVAQYNAFLHDAGSSEGVLNPRSADVLSIALLDRQIDDVLRAIDGRGPGRPSRAATLAKRFAQFRSSEPEGGPVS